MVERRVRADFKARSRMAKLVRALELSMTPYKGLGIALDSVICWNSAHRTFRLIGSHRRLLFVARANDDTWLLGSLT
jgi:cyanophycinase-like exopeptidase